VSSTISKPKAEDLDEQIGVTIVKRALEEPLRQIAQNAGMEGAVIVGKVREDDSANYGFNASSREI
jgi:chaperonin GroEL